MQIIAPSRHITTISYALQFNNADGVGGFSFDCDIDGNVELPRPNSAAQSNYEYCMAESIKPNGKVLAAGIGTYTNTYFEASIGLCPCGRSVQLDAFTNTCDCGRDYNTAGQLLAPREQWGEETGKTASDILRIR